MRGFIALSTIAFIAACGPDKRHGGGDDDNGGDSGPCSGNSCSASCQAAADNHASVGCDYYAVDMDGASGPPYEGCYAVFVANVSMDPVHINVERGGTAIDLGQFAKLPRGTGQSLTYNAYDPTAGLAPGDVAILFLDYNLTVLGIPSVPCPVPAALKDGVQVHGTGIGQAFHITTDTPVVAYQMLPYGGGSAAATGASLLIPTTAWQTNYLAASAWDSPSVGIDIPIDTPSHDIVAMADNTTITMRPMSDIAAAAGVPAGTKNSNWTITLNKGQYVQISQSNPLSGSPITSSLPVGVFGGHEIMGIQRCCGDHGEQMLTPVSALSSEYVAAPHGDRKPAGSPDPRVFHIWAPVDGTQLTLDGAAPATAMLNASQMLEVQATGAFVVKSQDTDHPFALFTYMTGAGTDDDPTDPQYDPNWIGGWGDPDFVRVMPPAQYLSHYVFFTDPTYPFTTLTVTRHQKMGGGFADVTLDCMGTIPASMWQPVGSAGDYQVAYVKLVDHWNSQNGCNNGVHVMDSAQQFGVWVWGWGSKDTNTGWVSYGYPAGEAVLPINNVIIE